MKKENKFKKLADILDKMTKDEAYDAAEWIYENYHVCLYPSNVELTEEMKEIVDEIFTLAPFATCIPFTFNYDEGNEHTTLVEIEDLMELRPYLTNPDCETCSTDEPQEIMPYFSDSLTKGNWKRIYELWNRLLERINLQKIIEDGDYCEYYHVSTHVIMRDYSIQELIDINR